MAAEALTPLVQVAARSSGLDVAAPAHAFSAARIVVPETFLVIVTVSDDAAALGAYQTSTSSPVLVQDEPTFVHVSDCVSLMLVISGVVLLLPDTSATSNVPAWLGVMAGNAAVPAPAVPSISLSPAVVSLVIVALATPTRHNKSSIAIPTLRDRPMRLYPSPS